MFIVFEGIDGSGKTTLSKKLAEFLNKKGIKAVWTREPFSEHARELLKEDLNPWGETHLFLADRNFHVRSFIKPKLEKGYTVISDRFYHSTLAYQGYGKGLPIRTLKAMNERVLEGIKPDLVFLLDIEPQKALGRIKLSGRKTVDKFENGEFLEKVRKGFLTLAKREKNFYVIDASENIHTVFGKIIIVLGRFLRLRGGLE
jgi:dTMP kinase